MGEIVVPELDTPENHRRLGEIRAAELERAMGALGVTEWENLGYHDSDMMGRPGNRDARSFWQADLDEAIGRLVFLVRTLPAGRHDDLQRVRRLRAPGPHPDPPRGGRARSRGRATRRGTRSSWRPSTAGPARPRARAASRRGRRPSSTSRRSRRRSATRSRSGWRRSASARSGRRRRTRRPEQIAEFEAFAARMLVPDEAVTAWVDVSSRPRPALGGDRART